MLIVQCKKGELLPIGEAIQVKVLKIGWRTVRLMVANAAEAAASQATTERRRPSQPDCESPDDGGFFVWPIGF